MKKQKSLFDNFNALVRPKKDDPHLHLWETWDKGGRKPEHLEPLLDAFEPDIQRKAKQIHSGMGGSVPVGFVEGEVRIAAKKGLESFVPGSGSKVRSWVITNFQRTTTPLAKARNFAYVPKNRVELYQRFQNAKNEFLTQHGHEPTFEEMHNLLPDLPENTLRPLMDEFRVEKFIGGHPDPEAPDGSHGHAPSQVRSILLMMPSMLTTEEKKVFDHLYPTAGTEPPSIAQIAKKTGLTQNQVYRVRADIYEKVKPHLKGL